MRCDVISMTCTGSLGAWVPDKIVTMPKIYKLTNYYESKVVPAALTYASPMYLQPPTTHQPQPPMIKYRNIH